jgi:hypothetical protein
MYAGVTLSAPTIYTLPIENVHMYLCMTQQEDRLFIYSFDNSLVGTCRHCNHICLLSSLNEAKILVATLFIWPCCSDLR